MKNVLISDTKSCQGKLEVTLKFNGNSLSLQCKDRRGGGSELVVCKDRILLVMSDGNSPVKIDGGGGKEV